MKKLTRGIKDNLTDLDWWKSWIGIIVGSMILAAGFVFFINPYNIVPGGVYGASIVLHNLFPSIQVGTFGYMLDIPLLLLAIFLLGSNLGAKTCVASLITPFIMNVMSAMSYPDKAALESLDPALLIGGRLDMSEHLMLTSIIGALLIGVGSGIVVRSGATTGGSDVIAMMIQKYLKIRFSQAILIVDGTVVLFGFIVIGLGIGSTDNAESGSAILSLYSLLSIYVISRSVSYTINGSKDDKLLFIISETPLDELRSYILDDLDRTATIIKSQGLYTHHDKQMLFLVVRRKEVPEVKEMIKYADPKAFVVVTDAYDTFGEGWKTLPASGEVTPE